MQSLNNANQYSFFQLNSMLQRLSEQRSGGHDSELPLAIRYRAVASLGFPASDVDQCHFCSTPSKDFVELHVSFMGLYGPASPLPVYYTERIIQNSEADHPSRDFMDMFNHRMISLLQKCWDKYRYFCQYRNNGRDLYSRWFLSVAGIDVDRLSQQTHLQWHKLMPMVGVLSKNVCSADLIARVLKSYFGLPQVELKSWVPTKIEIPPEQCNSMGMSNSDMGNNLVLGGELIDCTGKFAIHLRQLSLQQYRDFLPGQKLFQQLQELIELVQKDALDFDLHLHLSEPDRQTHPLKSLEQLRLGWGSSLGEWVEDEPTRICVADYQNVLS